MGESAGLTSLFLVVLRRQPGYYRQIFQRRHVARDGIGSYDLAQQPPHDLSAASLRQGIGEADLLRLGEATDLLGHPDRFLAALLFLGL